MNQNNINKLKSDFPHLFAEDSYFSCSNGWFELIYNLCKDISKELDKLPQNEQDILAVDFKEKFGSLRFSIGFSFAFSPKSKFIQEGILALVNYAEMKSKTICEMCGKDGELRKDLSWVRTLCDKHYNDFHPKK